MVEEPKNGSIVLNATDLEVIATVEQRLREIEETISTETSFFKIKAEQLKVKIQWSLIQLRSPFGLNTSADTMKVKRST